MSVAGCKTHDELVVDVACQTVCPCFSDEDQLESCIAQCQAQLDPSDVPDACFECLLEEGDACATLEARCEPLCSF